MTGEVSQNAGNISQGLYSKPSCASCGGLYLLKRANGSSLKIIDRNKVFAHGIIAMRLSGIALDCLITY
jgi:small ligand-binding sensory domain FIST